VTGSPGITGPAGPQGLRGLTGATGPQGPAGPMPEGAIIIGEKCKYEDRHGSYEGVIGWQRNGDNIQLQCLIDPRALTPAP
jgi:hypothetical protein